MQRPSQNNGGKMTKRSILDLKRPHDTKVTITQYADCWQAAIMFPGAPEAMIIRRPTEKGLDNEATHQLRIHDREWYMADQTVIDRSDKNAPII